MSLCRLCEPGLNKQKWRKLYWSSSEGLKNLFQFAHVPPSPLFQVNQIIKHVKHWLMVSNSPCFGKWIHDRFSQNWLCCVHNSNDHSCLYFLSLHVAFCREYAVAKECITEKAKANCEICEQLSRDSYNPFCPNNTDPPLHTNGISNLLLRILSVCLSVCLSF